MDSQHIPSNTSSLSEDTVNHPVLIKEIMKMRGLSLEEKEKVLDVLAEIMGYQHSCESALEEESPVGAPNQNPQPIQANVVDNGGKKVLEISKGNEKISIRGYKAQLPRGSTVIRYRFAINGQDEPITGPGTKSQKFGHTKDKVVEKLLNHLGNEAQSAITAFTQYDSSFYNTQG